MCQLKMAIPNGEAKWKNNNKGLWDELLLSSRKRHPHCSRRRGTFLPSLSPRSAAGMVFSPRGNTENRGELRVPRTVVTVCLRAIFPLSPFGFPLLSFIFLIHPSSFALSKKRLFPPLLHSAPIWPQLPTLGCLQWGCLHRQKRDFWPHSQKLETDLNAKV